MSDVSKVVIDNTWVHTNIDEGKLEIYSIDDETKDAELKFEYPFAVNLSDTYTVFNMTHIVNNMAELIATGFLVACEPDNKLELSVHYEDEFDQHILTIKAEDRRRNRDIFDTRITLVFNRKDDAGAITREEVCLNKLAMNYVPFDEDIMHYDYFLETLDYMKICLNNYNRHIIIVWSTQ